MTQPTLHDPNTATITDVAILENGAEVGLVTHDEEDGMWQFLPFAGATQEEDGRVVALKTLLALDPSLAEVLDLPPGWRAWRRCKSDGWTRELIPA